MHTVVLTEQSGTILAPAVVSPAYCHYAQPPITDGATVVSMSPKSSHKYANTFASSLATPLSLDHLINYIHCLLLDLSAIVCLQLSRQTDTL